MNAGGDVFAFFETYLMQSRMEAAQDLTRVADRQKKNIARRKELRELDATLENAASSNDEFTQKELMNLSEQFGALGVNAGPLKDLTNRLLWEKETPQGETVTLPETARPLVDFEGAGEVPVKLEAGEDPSDEKKAAVSKNQRFYEKAKDAIKDEIANATDAGDVITYDMQRGFTQYNSATELMSRTEKKREESEKAVINNI
jgi:hypothetical protein